MLFLCFAERRRLFKARQIIFQLPPLGEEMGVRACVRACLFATIYVERTSEENEQQWAFRWQKENAREDQGSLKLRFQKSHR